MEFLVRSTTIIDPMMPIAERERLIADEGARADELAREGLLERTWRVPGRSANWSLWQVKDATALHDALSSLPLFPWLDIEVHPLAEHYADPGSADPRRSPDIDVQTVAQS